jgi:hypothetical protein
MLAESQAKQPIKEVSADNNINNVSHENSKASKQEVKAIPFSTIP